MTTVADAVIDDLFCPECGYNLRGIDDIDRCPECGHGLDRARLAASNIPWTHRHEIGAIRAYARTVWLLLRYPTRAAADIARPVSFADARKFRHVTVLIALVPLLALLAYACVRVVLSRPITMSSTAATEVRIGWALEIGLVPAIVVALYAFLLAASGVASYFFHPKSLPIERQNRAIALSYYACAPMALMPISVGSIVTALLVREHLAAQPAVIIGITLTACSLVPAVQSVMSLATPLQMLRRTTHCGVGRVIVFAAALPMLWASLAVVIAIGIPVAYVYVATVIMSLIA